MILTTVSFYRPSPCTKFSGQVNAARVLTPHLAHSLYQGTTAPKISSRKFSEFTIGVIVGSVATYFFASIQNQKEKHDLKVGLEAFAEKWGHRIHDLEEENARLSKIKITLENIISDQRKKRDFYPQRAKQSSHPLD